MTHGFITNKSLYSFSLISTFFGLLNYNYFYKSNNSYMTANGKLNIYFCKYPIDDLMYAFPRDIGDITSISNEEKREARFETNSQFNVLRKKYDKMYPDSSEVFIYFPILFLEKMAKYSLSSKIINSSRVKLTLHQHGEKYNRRKIYFGKAYSHHKYDANNFALIGYNFLKSADSLIQRNNVLHESIATNDINEINALFNVDFKNFEINICCDHPLFEKIAYLDIFDCYFHNSEYIVSLDNSYLHIDCEKNVSEILGDTL